MVLGVGGVSYEEKIVEVADLVEKSAVFENHKLAVQSIYQPSATEDSSHRNASQALQIQNRLPSIQSHRLSNDCYFE